MKNRLRGGANQDGEPSPECRAATIPALGESISNLANVVQQLKKKRAQAQRRVEQVEQALKAPQAGHPGSL
jgi:hypothetical protein